MSVESELVNAPVPKLPEFEAENEYPEELVATLPGRPWVEVEYTNPLVSALAPPIEVMFPFAVAVVAVILDAACVVTVGNAAGTVNVFAPDVPPAGLGLKTVIETLVARVRSAAGIVATIVVAEIDVVASDVPFHCGTDELTKLVPVRVSVVFPLPAAVVVGLMLVKVGEGLLVVYVITIIP